MKKKILITGSNGFIGNNIKLELEKRYKVYGIGRGISKEKQYFQIDLKDKLKVVKLFKKIKFDIIIHCAWYTKHSDYRKSKKNIQYLEMSKFLLDTFIQNGGKTFIGIGTCEEYDKKKFSKNIFSESTKIKPINLYAKTKDQFHSYLKTKKIDYKWLRVFYLFGDGENKKRLFPVIIDGIANNKVININYPYFKTDFIYVKNLAKIIKKLITKNINGEFNICAGKSLRIKKVFETINKLLNKSKKLKLNNKRQLDYEEIYATNTKLKKNKIYIKSDFKKDIKNYLSSFKHFGPRI